MMRFIRQIVLLCFLCSPSVASAVQGNDSLADRPPGIVVFPVKTVVGDSVVSESGAPSLGKDLMLAAFDGLDQLTTEFASTEGSLSKGQHNAKAVDRRDFRFSFWPNRVRPDAEGPSLTRLKIFAHLDLVEGVMTHAYVLLGRDFLPHVPVETMDACGELLFEDHNPASGGEYYLKLGFGESLKYLQWPTYNRCKLERLPEDDRLRVLAMLRMVPELLARLGCSRFLWEQASYPKEWIEWMYGADAVSACQP